MAKNLLCIETSSLHGSLALFNTHSKELLGDICWTKKNSHSEVITLKCQQLLEKADLKISEIDELAVSIGPGSFTGIRVGLSFAKTLGYSRNLKIFTLDALSILAFSAVSKNHKIVSLINAHKNKIYTSTFNSEPFKMKISPQAIRYDELDNLLPNEKFIALGNAFELHFNSFSHGLKSRLIRDNNIEDHPQAKHLGAFLLHTPKEPRLKTWNEVLPLYIRSSEAEENLWSGILKPALKV